jgi:carboxyl-terminal processing protease
MSQISAELYLRNYIFDYATQYYWAHPDIKTTEQFSLTDKDYADFTAMLIKRNFSYRTNTEESFNDLIASAKREKYYDVHKDLFTALEKDLAHDLNEDLTMFRSEISDLIEDEVISRYFYEDGAIAWTIKKDEQILKALKVLNNKDEYNSILKGKSGSILVTSKENKTTSIADLQKSKKNQEPV